jgi:hypothetical protein
MSFFWFSYVLFASRYRTGEISIHFIVYNITMACNSIFYKFLSSFPIGSYLINVAICFIISNNNFYRHCVYMEYLRSDKSDRKRRRKRQGKCNLQEKVSAENCRFSLRKHSVFFLLSFFFGRYKHVLSPSGCDKVFLSISSSFTPPSPTRKKSEAETPLLESSRFTHPLKPQVYTHF